jgi:hypothetical protein
MRKYSKLRVTIQQLSVAAVTVIMAYSVVHAQTPAPALPPLSVTKAQHFQNNPTAWNTFLTQLPRRPSGSPQLTPRTMQPAFGGSWTAVNAAPAGLCNPLLLTDGTVMAANCNTPSWYRLTPDITGSYANGSWRQIASLPVINGTQYAPQYYASAVLPDGRVLIMGGEYNGSNTEVWTNLGAIYDPVANTWTAVSPPAGSSWTQIGDAQSVVLANGTFMLASCCAKPDVDALFNAGTLTWTSTGAPSAGGAYQDEQGYELLPNGNVLTIDIWTDYPAGNATNAEQYVPSSGTWTSAGNTPVPLADPYQCGNWEIGPAVMRPDGTMVAFGGNTGCTASPPISPVDPTAIYNSTSGVWTAGPYIPFVCGTGGTTSCTLADAPAALLPDGNILFAASAGFAAPPTHFFEFSSTDAINQVADPIYNAGTEGSYEYNFLVLPSGQIFTTDLSNTAEVYSPTGSAASGVAPSVSTAPSVVAPGATYSLSGFQFNGLSQGAYYGDDVQGATNYPLVRIVNNATGHVFYARTFGHSTMSVAPNAAGSTNFTVPNPIESGASQLFVVANGVASQPENITIKPNNAFISPIISYLLNN